MPHQLKPADLSEKPSCLYAPCFSALNKPCEKYDHLYYPQHTTSISSHALELHLIASVTLHGWVKVLFCQPEKRAAWGEPRGRSPTKSSTQTAPRGQPTGQGWLGLLQAPWEHLCPPLPGSRCPQMGPGTPWDEYFSQLWDARPSTSPADALSLAFACGSRPHACIMLVARCGANEVMFTWRLQKLYLKRLLYELCLK